MDKKIHKLLCPSIILLVFTSLLQAQSYDAAETKITVEVNKTGHTISPTLFGLFFEDINLSADVGIYPELVRNRSFEDADTLQNWEFVSADGKSTAIICNADIQARPPVPPLNPFNRKFLFINSDGAFRLKNSGYWGMNIVQGNSYLFKMAARSVENFNAPLKIRVISSNETELSSGEIREFKDEWKYFSINLTASGSDPTAHLEISGEGKGKLYLD